MVVKCISFVLLFGLAWAQSDFPVSLPPEIQASINPDQLSDLGNKTLPIVKNKCEKNGGPGAFEKAENASREFEKCIKNLVDMETLNREIEKASPNGQVDEVFKKYCAKTHSFEGCFSDMFDAAKGCMSPKERDNLKIVYNVTEQLAEFICHKEGDRIALFISEGGRECFEEKQEQLQDCANKTVGGNLQMPGENFNPDDIPNISFGETECKQLSELQTCVVQVLETCPKPTTGNIVDSMFKFIRKATPCNDIADVKEKSKPGSATGLAATSATLLLVAGAALLL